MNNFIATLRNVRRSMLYSSIIILGLAVGISTALIAALLIRNELSYDRFIPDYDRTYVIASLLIPTDRPRNVVLASNDQVAAFLKWNVPEIESLARIKLEETLLRRQDVKAKEQVYWADPEIFDVLPLPTRSGNLRAALTRADGIVIPRSIARKYFGRDNVVGETLEISKAHLMTVTAVIEDLPIAGTNLESGIFASALAAYSKLPPQGTSLEPGSGYSIGSRTYFRLKPDASIQAVERTFPKFFERMLPFKMPSVQFAMQGVRVDRARLIPEINPGVHTRLYITGAVGALVLLIAGINFVNLTTARSSRRAVEMATRKVFGARRRDLLLQILSESLLYVTAAMLVAMMLTELLLPRVNAFLQTGATFEYWRDPSLLLGLACGVVVLTVLGGFYPALILSAFRPIDVLRGAVTHSRAATTVRQGLVTLQFIILIGLIVASVIGYRQRLFAATDALRVNVDQHLMVESGCKEAFKNEIAALPGVQGVACVGQMLLKEEAFGVLHVPGRTDFAIGVVGVETGTLELLDLKPLAGRFIAHDLGHIVLNETALHKAGYRTPADAIGQHVEISGEPKTIVGVVKDFTLRTLERPIDQLSYEYIPGDLTLLDVKLRGENIPETLASIDRLWKGTGAEEPINRYFLNEHIQGLYLSVLREAKVYGVLSAVAIVLGCLGLVGLSASATDRRTKEIGIRKAMGADTRDVVRLMVWQLARPVLWASLVAIPLSAYAMNRWLEGFAFHIALTPWPFLGSALAAMLIAVLTVGVHCYSVARAKPVTALRYE